MDVHELRGFAMTEAHHKLGPLLDGRRRL